MTGLLNRGGTRREGIRNVLSSARLSAIVYDHTM